MNIVQALLSGIIVILLLYSFRNIDFIAYAVVTNYLFNVLGPGLKEAGIQETLVGINILGVNLYGNDLIIIFMLFHIIVQIIRNGALAKRTLRTLMFSIFVIIVFVSMVRGIFIYGVTAEWLGDFRKYFEAIVGLVFFSNFYGGNIPEKYIERIMSVIIAYLYVGIFLNIAGLYPIERPVYADQASILVYYALYKFYKEFYIEDKMLSLKTYLAILGIIVNRYNSTWISLIVGLVILVALSRRGAFTINKIKNIAVICVSVVFCAVYFMLNADTEFMLQIAGTADKFSNLSEGSFGTRQDVWAGLISMLKGGEVLWGQPFGSGFFTIYRGNIWEASPHNGYIETIMRCGYIGVITLCGYMILSVANGIKHKNNLYIAILLSTMVFWIPYSVVPDAFFVLGALEYFDNINCQEG